MSSEAARHLRALELPVVDAARELVGCTISHGPCSGVIAETEAYHDSEPACHAFVGLTARTATLFEAPGIAYVYRSYGIHFLLNVVVEAEGVGAAVLIRALAPLEGIGLMQERRGRERDRPLLGAGQAHPGAGNRSGPQCKLAAERTDPARPAATRGERALRGGRRDADRDHAGGRASVALLCGRQPPCFEAVAAGAAALTV